VDLNAFLLQVCHAGPVVSIVKMGEEKTRRVGQRCNAENKHTVA
jgi:hypothetical protein